MSLTFRWSCLHHILEITNHKGVFREKSLEIYGRSEAGEMQEFYGLGHWLGECFIKVNEKGRAPSNAYAQA